MLEWKLTDVFPLFICTTFYLIVFFLAELTRKIVDMSVKKGTNFYIFVIELIATAQMCTCVYENGIMIKHYGVSGFFFIVICLLYVGSLINRGAFVSPFAPIEKFYYGAIKFDQLFLVLLAQAIGGYSAFRLVSVIFNHHQFYENLPCTLNYKVPFFAAIAYEIIACFLMRLIIPRLHTRYQPYIAPMVTSAFLSFALAYIGVPALNPVTVSSRLQGCYGLDLQWFILTYWICPVIGWMAAAVLDHRAKVNVGGKSKKKK
uniref:Aquaporin n=1 Tax=Acrobeloides nanus TaxID=290746 RepID=A0A914EMV0_9BILA